MVNDATIRLITEFEGFVPNWYADPAHGWKVPTAMYGHTNATGNEPFYKSEADRKIKFTKDQAIATLKADLAKYEAAVDKLTKVNLNPNQRGALVSFTYNLGEGNLAKSTLLKKVNAGDFAGASKEFAKWNKAGGKVMVGLTRRREAERQLFMAPAASIFEPLPVPPDMPIDIVIDDLASDPITTTPRSFNIWPWVLAAVVVSVLFIVTQVKF